MNELLTMLESKYKRLEYIESTGTQYIDTGYVPTENDVIECDVQNLTLEAGEKFFFGQRTLDNDKGGLWVEQATNNVWYVRFGSTSSVSANPTNQDKNNKIHLTLKKGSFISGGGTTLSPVWSGTMQSSSLTLFCRWNTAGTNAGFSKVRYWNFRITNNGVTKLNLVPVLRKSDNELGMLDLVEGKFYPNAGTGKFTANLDTMYALIQGTPTVQDGRVSGFSADNYLKTNFLMTSAIQARYRKSFEVQVKITLPNSFDNEQQIIHIPYRGILNGFSVRTTGRIRWYIIGGSTYINSQTIFSANTSIFIKGVISNEVATLYSSNDGENWITEGSANLSNDAINETDASILFGVRQDTGGAFLGTIDLNRSYIKIDDTKYKLQAVVGYTKVGSPTIVDGVVSGFSSANYLQINRKDLDFYSQSSFDFTIKFKAGETGTTGTSIVFGLRCKATGQEGNYGVYLNSNNTGAIYCGFDENNQLISANLSFVAGNTYYLRWGKENGILFCSISTDGINWTILCNDNGANNTTTPTDSYRKKITIFRIAWSNLTLDLNETHIKVNNKLWFNGLEA